VEGMSKMKNEYIIKCESRDELECIENALDTYELWLSNQIQSFGTSDYLIDDYNKRLELVEIMIKNLE